MVSHNGWGLRHMHCHMCLMNIRDVYMHLGDMTVSNISVYSICTYIYKALAM